MKNPPKTDAETLARIETRVNGIEELACILTEPGRTSVIQQCYRMRAAAQEIRARNLRALADGMVSDG